MTKFNLSKPKKYTDKRTGEEKTFWQNIGTMTEFVNNQTGKVSRIIEIPAIGLECNVFPIEPRSQQGTGYQAPAAQSTQQPAVQRPTQTPATEEIDIKDIPF